MRLYFTDDHSLSFILIPGELCLGPSLLPTFLLRVDVAGPQGGDPPECNDDNDDDGDGDDDDNDDDDDDDDDEATHRITYISRAR